MKIEFLRGYKINIEGSPVFKLRQEIVPIKAKKDS